LNCPAAGSGRAQVTGNPVSREFGISAKLPLSDKPGEFGKRQELDLRRVSLCAIRACGFPDNTLHHSD
jgi:hypothetical protein